MDMIERVAKALSQQLDKDGYYVDAARAAIEAMRDPTPEMEKGLQAYLGSLTAYDEPSCETAYRAMVDAALKERANVTGNLVGTDTRMIGAPDCECQGCRAADKIEGLEADLDSAVEVAYRSGATEWVRMNYPAKYAALKEHEGAKG